MDNNYFVYNGKKYIVEYKDKNMNVYKCNDGKIEILSDEEIQMIRQLLNSKYMSVVSKSSLNCDSGSITGTFLKIDCGDNSVDRNGGLKYRNDVKDRLANHKPLILKIYDGRIWMINVTGNPTDTQGGHYDIRQISFEWIEIGDINDMRTLYNYGFSDVDSRWW